MSSDHHTTGFDPFLFDAEQLKELASASIVRRGLAYFKEGRVIDLGWDRQRVWAAVEGTRPGPYQVDLFLDEEGELGIDCDCPFEWEPACKHVVATLLSYAARRPVSDDQVADAATLAIETRMQRGRSEVSVQHVAGDRWFGTWEARSLDSPAASGAPWRVELRSVSERINFCRCPDFAVNRLGTCKHIEAVLHTLQKKAPKKFERAAQAGPAISFVFLDWQGAALPKIRLHRAAGADAAWLDEHFDHAGLLRGELPDAFERMAQQARRAGMPVITPEVEEHVSRLVEESKRRRDAARLGDRLRDSGGQMEGVAARLYPYQVEGVAFLATAGRALLADDMGLGKTLQAIAATAVLRRHRGVSRTLVICPTSLKHQWAREIHRFTGLDSTVVEGPPAARLALYRRQRAFTIANYEVLLRDHAQVQEELAPDLLILDEAQRIKNWRTKTATAVKAMVTPFAFVLTGTPLENRLEDLYSLMQVVDPGVLGPLWRYLLDFHVTDGRGKVLGYRNLTELRGRLAPVMLRRDKSLVRDQLPERIDNRLDVELDRKQRDLHDEAMAAAARIGRIAKKRKLTPGEEKRLMAALQSARMACDAAGLVDRATQGSPKLTELASLLEELCVDGGRKVVVFSQWERMTRMAEERARCLSLGTVRLHGGVPAARRGALIDRFRDDPTVQVFLSTDAGGVGLNLQAASVLINLDLPWNPAVLAQRIGRVHRLGQVEPVQVFVMVARESYEERIASLLDSKRELFRNVVDEGEEDVVGVSKRMVDLALATLDDDEEDGATAPPPEPAQDPLEPVLDAQPEPAVEVEAPSRATEPGSGVADESLAPVIGALQAAWAERIEQVVAVGGGLVVVVKTLDGSEEALAAGLGAQVSIAVIESSTWAALSRLGVGAGSVELAPVPAAPTASSAPAAAPSQAERKLAAARVLADQGFGSEAVSLAATAILHALAEALGAETPPLERAAVWLHAELVPAGHVSVEDAATIQRALALAAAQDLPAELVAAVLADAERLTTRD